VYVDNFKSAAVGVALAEAASRHLVSLGVSVENPTDTNFASVELALHFEGEIVPFDEDEEFISEAVMPTPPRLWGTLRPPASLTPNSIFATQAALTNIDIPRMPQLRRMQIGRGESGTVTFSAFDLRPRESLQLTTFHLSIPRLLAGQEAEATWSATSTSVNGVASGRLAFHVSPEPLTPQEPVKARLPDAGGITGILVFAADGEGHSGNGQAPLPGRTPSESRIPARHRPLKAPARAPTGSAASSRRRSRTPALLSTRLRSARLASASIAANHKHA
jgi:hypothetical protein